MQACIKQILEHDAFAGINVEAPTNLVSGFASCDPVDEAKCAQAFSADKKTYYCSINFWSLDLAHWNTPSVPILRSTIEGLMQRYFKSCAPLPHTMVGCAASAQHAASELKLFKVVVVSSPELVFAYIFAVQCESPLLSASLYQTNP